MTEFYAHPVEAVQARGMIRRCVRKQFESSSCRCGEIFIFERLCITLCFMFEALRFHVQSRTPFADDRGGRFGKQERYTVERRKLDAAAGTGISILLRLKGAVATGTGKKFSEHCRCIVRESGNRVP